VLLSRIHLAGVGPFERLTIPLDEDGGAPRPLVVLFGGEGVGKTSILAAIASTRPGHAIAQGPAPAPDAAPPLVAADWVLGEDDPARPHPLRVVSPNAKLEGERDDLVLLRRREQALFDRRAAEGGFTLVTFSGARWFSRTPVMLTTPDRTILRYDPRGSTSFDDATRADLARETKQVLTYAAVAAAIAPSSRAPSARYEALDRGLRAALAALLDDTDVAYLGIDPARLEPTFDLGGRTVDFDDLPRSLRHRIAFGALTIRALAAAYPDRDPRGAEGVALVDDLEVEQDLRAQRALPSLLRQALPRVQWIITTASPAVAMGCDAAEVMALRRTLESGRVELHQGPLAVMH
jgi:hypothetical protein